MAARFQFRRANASAWASANPTLAAGELGYELDTGKFKIGNGSTAWNSLTYFSSGSGTGGSGISGADAPLVYDTENQTVSLSYGDGLTVDNNILKVNTSRRFTQVFTKNGLLEAKTYNSKWVSDGDYTIKKARVVVGTHDSATHPSGDGCPVGGAIYVQIKKYDTTDSNPVNVFTSDGRLKVDAGTHKDTAWASDVNIASIAEDEILRIKVTKDAGNTYMGKDLTVTVILEPA